MVTIWGGISSKGKILIYILKQGERINQEVYKSILDTCLIPWAKEVFPSGHYIRTMPDRILGNIYLNGWKAKST